MQKGNTSAFFMLPWTALFLFAALGVARSADREPIRIAPLLRERLLLEPGGFADDIEVTVRFSRGAPPDLVRSEIERCGGLPGGAWPEIRRFNARIPADRIAELAASGLVEWIEERAREDLDRDESDGLRKALGYEGLTPLPGLLRGEGVKVGAWEAGHPDTESMTGTFPGHDDLAGRVKVMEDSSPTSHATGVAGVVAGNGVSSASRGGVQLQWHGLAPRAQILSYSTNDSDEEAIELLTALREEGIHLSIQAWGESVNRTRCEIFGDYSIRAAEFDQVIAGEDPAAAGEGRAPVVFSVGNYQNFLECPIRGGGGQAIVVPGFWTINPPHTAKNIIAVGAVYSDDLTMTPFSSWGPTDDGRLKPDLVAPGSERGGDRGITGPAFDPSDGYRSDEGTSYSAAATAGSLALLIGERMARGAPPLPPAAWKAILVESAQDLRADPVALLDPLEPGISYRGPDYCYGYGLIRLPGALRLSLSPDSLREGTVAHGEERRFSLEVPAGAEGFRATLVWDDPPGEPGAPQALVNDLDLTVHEQFGTGIVQVHQPWVLDRDRPDRPATRGIDRINNVEQVELDGPVAGRLTLVVSGSRVTRGPQRFWVAVCQQCSIIPERLPLFARGDANADGAVNIADPILVLSYLFQGNEIPCADGADANDDGVLNIADGVRLLNFLFLGQLPPNAPKLDGECLLDSTPDQLLCHTLPDCPQ